MSAGPDYPLSLAVEDFVPVVLTGVGAALLIGPLRKHGARTAARTAAAGTALVLLGGLSKATWKLLVALDGPDVQGMDKALFPCLSAGFLLLAHAVLTLPPDGRGPGAGRRPPPLWGLASLWLAAGAAGLLLGSTVPNMVVAIVAVSVCGVRLILLARSDGDIPAAVAGGLWLSGMYVLGPLAARPEQSVALQWVEQSANTLTQGAFVVLAWRLAKRRRDLVSSSSPSSPASPSSGRSAA
ncbi:hypothetical protein [Streptomyces sp. NPDC002990]